jgi:glycosyltransferase involved in cell wall biosynthesis
VKLALVNSAWAAAWGGGEKWTVEAGVWLREHEHEVLIVGRPASRLLEAARQRDLNVQKTPFGGDVDPLALLRAGRILRQFGAQLVCVNFNKEAWQFGLAALGIPIPIVARHGLTALSGDWHHRLLAERVLTKLVVNAQMIREEYARRGLPAEDMEVIPNGVRAVEQQRGELRQGFDIPESAQLVLGAGRLESQKRFDVFLNMAAELVSERKNVRFLICGEGPQQDALERQIAALHLQEYAKLTGFVPDLAALAGDADLFWLTSDEEGAPNVMLEAMAAGVACVAFAVGSVPEILSGSLAPFCIPRGNVAAFTAQAATLLDDDEMKRTTALLMRERTENEFSFDVSMKRYETLFQNLIAS